METQLSNSGLLLFSAKIYLLLFYILHHPLSSGAATNSAAPTTTTTTTNPFDFILSSCNATLYPKLCYTSLSRYANDVQQSPAHLARVAIGVSLARAHRASVYFSDLGRQAQYGVVDPRAASALHDCSSTFGDAVDQIRGSLKQMRQLGSAGDGEEALRFQLSNVQTWMSAALTNEDTCSDGFQDVAEGPVKSGVCDRVATVKEFTSNALALVNSFAASLSS